MTKPNVEKMKARAEECREDLKGKMRGLNVEPGEEPLELVVHMPLTPELARRAVAALVVEVGSMEMLGLDKILGGTVRIMRLVALQLADQLEAAGVLDLEEKEGQIKPGAGTGDHFPEFLELGMKVPGSESGQ